MRVPARLIALLLTAAVTSPALPAGAQEPPRVFALGGPSVLPDEALIRAQRELGAPAVRLAGADRFATAVAISRHAHPEGAQTLYVVTAGGFPDALAASTAVTARGAALLPVDRDAVPDVVAAEVTRLAPERVYVVGGPGAVSEAVRARLRELTGQKVLRLAGVDRYDTAALLSRHAHPHGAAAVYVAAGTGTGAADALAASAALDAHQAALLLTEPHSLPAVTAQELRRLGAGNVHVIGGASAVSDEVLGQIAAITGVTPRRLAGADRVATSRVLAGHSRPGGAQTVYLAAARAPVDALMAAAAVAAHDGVLLLIEPHAPVAWLPRLDEAIAFARTRRGSISFAAIGTDGALAGHRADTRVPAASVLKVMFMVAHLRTAAGRELTQSDRALLEPMIRRSANEPATQIANRLGPGPMYQLAADAGMRDFSYTRPWGNSRTSARDQARFMLQVDRYVPERHRDYALRLLTEVVPEQRWGIGEVATPPWTQHFKGGWGSGTGATDHQVVLLRHPDGTRVALAVMTTSSPSHAYGKDTLREVFRRLLAGLPRDVA